MVLSMTEHRGKHRFPIITSTALASFDPYYDPLIQLLVLNSKSLVPVLISVVSQCLKGSAAKSHLLLS